MTTPRSEPKVIERDHPYAPARVTSSGIVLVSGALSVDEAYQPVQGARGALDAAMAGVERRLATVGVSLRGVVKLVYYVTDVGIRDEANSHFLEVFGDPAPARTFVEVSALPYGADVEIDATAELPAH